MGRNIKILDYIEFRKRKFAYFEFRSLFSFLVGRLAGRAASRLSRNSGDPAECRLGELIKKVE